MHIISLVSKLQNSHLKTTDVFVFVFAFVTDVTWIVLGTAAVLFPSKATKVGFLEKQTEQKYFCSPLWISSLSSFFVLEHSKCSKNPHFTQSPTASLLFRLRPVYLQFLATHFTRILHLHYLLLFQLLPGRLLAAGTNMTIC